MRGVDFDEAGDECVNKTKSQPANFLPIFIPVTTDFNITIQIMNLSIITRIDSNTTRENL